MSGRFATSPGGEHVSADRCTCCALLNDAQDSFLDITMVDTLALLIGS